MVSLPVSNSARLQELHSILFYHFNKRSENIKLATDTKQKQDDMQSQSLLFIHRVHS